MSANWSIMWIWECGRLRMLESRGETWNHTSWMESEGRDPEDLARCVWGRANEETREIIVYDPESIRNDRKIAMAKRAVLEKLRGYRLHRFCGDEP